MFAAACTVRPSHRASRAPGRVRPGVGLNRLNRLYVPPKPWRQVPRPLSGARRPQCLGSVVTKTSGTPQAWATWVPRVGWPSMHAVVSASRLYLDLRFQLSLIFMRRAVEGGATEINLKIGRPAAHPSAGLPGLRAIMTIRENQDQHGTLPRNAKQA